MHSGGPDDSRYDLETSDNLALTFHSSGQAVTININMNIKVAIVLFCSVLTKSLKNIHHNFTSSAILYIF